MDSFDKLALQKYAHLTPAEQKLAANAMRVWFNYEKPLAKPSFWQRIKNLWDAL